MTPRKAMLVAVCSILVACYAPAQTHPDLINSVKDITSEDQVGEWLTYYYLHPLPDLLIPALRIMSKDGWFKKGDSPVSAFLAQVFVANPDRLSGWSTDVASDPEGEKAVMAVALWMANGDTFRQTLMIVAKGGSPGFQEKIRAYSRKQPPNLLRDEITSPQFLDALWSSFFATGDERYVQRLIGALPMADTKGDVPKMLIGGAARWSLTSNAIQHPRVMEICEAQLNTLSDDQKTALKKVIDSAREKRK